MTLCRHTRKRAGRCPRPCVGRTGKRNWSSDKLGSCATKNNQPGAKAEVSVVPNAVPRADGQEMIRVRSMRESGRQWSDVSGRQQAEPGWLRADLESPDIGHSIA